MLSISTLTRPILLGGSLLCFTACALHIPASDANSIVQYAAATTPIVTSTPQIKQSDKAPGKVTIVPAQPREEYAALWERVIDGFDLGDKSRDEVETELESLSRHRRSTQALLKRASPHLWEIVEAVEKRDLPLELALLPAIESRYNPTARSPKQAVGLWQFMPHTAKRHGLEQNWWVDKRLDVTASTTAALDYLQALEKRFDDWALALAAYNCGEACVNRAIRNAEGNEDFWTLDLPQETRRYVPRLLALAEIVEEHEDHGIRLPELPDQQMTDIVVFERQIDIALAAKHARIPIKTMQQLNPALLRWATPPDGPHRLRVPSGKSKQLQSAMRTVPATAWTQWQSYFVQEGDSLSVIAERHGMHSSDLKRFNKLNSNLIRTGQALLLPTSVATAKASQVKKQVAVSPPVGTVRKDYVIQPGDNLWNIAKAHQITVTALSRWNGLQTNSILRPGRILILWVMPITSSS